MDLAKKIRLNRIFSHPSKRLCSVAIDHFIGYQKGLPAGLANLPKSLEKIMRGGPDAVTMFKGVAKGMWEPYAGQAALIVQAVSFTADDAVIESLTRPAEALRLGADAIAVSLGVRGPNEGKFLRILSDMVHEADAIGLPVIAHIYPRDFAKAPASVVFDHDNIMWAVRCGIECGADVIKVPFTGEVDSFREIIATSPVPVVAAGGPRCESLEPALKMIAKVIASGARGATIGRNVWGTADPTQAVKAFRAVIHDGLSPIDALQSAESDNQSGRKVRDILPGKQVSSDGKAKKVMVADA